MARILLVDDDPQGLDTTRRILEAEGWEVISAVDGQAALDLVREAREGRAPAWDLVLSDVRMPHMTGTELFRSIQVLGDSTPIILMTAFGKVEDAVWALKAGAVDFLTKPFKRQALLQSVRTALKRREVARAAQPKSAGASVLTGQSLAMREIRSLAERIAPTQVTVLIGGESGSGKERVARYIHDRSARASAPWVAINCAALPESLMESELFGHDKGAFTGATESKTGLFEAASGGTLFLDEVGDMPASVQAKLLRVLQEGEIRRVGSTLTRKVDVRLIAASHRDLRQMAKEGTFREDLLYRLEVVSMKIPSLRDRPEDIPDLVYRFVEEHSARHGARVKHVSEAAMEVLLAYAWPGNVRELANVLERAVILSDAEKSAPRPFQST